MSARQLRLKYLPHVSPKFDEDCKAHGVADARKRNSIFRDIASSKSAWKKDRQQRGWRQGDNVYMLCPFHKEKTPSCVWVGKKKFFYCFGCGSSGSMIQLARAIKTNPKDKPYRPLFPPNPPSPEELRDKDIPF